MTEPSLVERYNYDAFTPANFEPWMLFDSSPPLGVTAPDFPLWDLNGKEVHLAEIFAGHRFTLIEFGSFT